MPTVTPTPARGKPFFSVSLHFTNHTLNPYEVALVAALQAFSQRNGYCWPSVDTLATLTKMSKRKLLTTRQALEDKGVIKTIHRKSKDGGNLSNTYEINLYACVNLSPGECTTCTTPPATTCTPPVHDVHPKYESKERAKTGKAVIARILEVVTFPGGQKWPFSGVSASHRRAAGRIAEHYAEIAKESGEGAAGEAWENDVKLVAEWQERCRLEAAKDLSRLLSSWHDLAGRALMRRSEAGGWASDGKIVDAVEAFTGSDADEEAAR